MHWARLAPELSATVTMVRSWIMFAPCWGRPARSRPAPRALAGALHESREAPALVLGQRTRLHEANDVPDAALVLLVVHLELLATAHVPPVGDVLHQALDGDDHGLLHAVAHHLAYAHFPAIAFGRFRRHVVGPDPVEERVAPGTTASPRAPAPAASRSAR